MHDVIIVGGSVSGLSCATFLASKGLDVLVLEKGSAIGAHVNENMQGFPFYEVDKVDIEIPKDKPVKKAYIWSPDRERIELNFAEPILYLVERGPGDSFDSYLANKAVAAGVKIRLNSKVIEVARGNTTFEGVRTSGGEFFKGKHIVAADGPISSMRKMVGIDSLGIKGIGYGLKMHNVSVGALSVNIIFDTDVAPGGYGYVIGYPNGKYATVAIACRSKCMQTTLKAYFGVFRNFIASLLEEATEIHPFSGVVTCGDGTQAVAKGNVLFIGEAGGFQDPIFGFGMAACIRSARLCADIIVRDCQQGSSLGVHEFEREAKNQLMKEEVGKRRSMRKLTIERMNNKDLAALISALQGNENVLLHALGTGNWKKITRHLVFKAVLRRPALLRLITTTMPRLHSVETSG
jgi:flavin-dependent dehydrogenase